VTDDNLTLGERCGRLGLRIFMFILLVILIALAWRWL